MRYSLMSLPFILQTIMLVSTLQPCLLTRITTSVERRESSTIKVINWGRRNPGNGKSKGSKGPIKLSDQTDEEINGTEVLTHSSDQTDEESKGTEVLVNSSDPIDEVYDCAEGFPHCKLGWSKDKKKWCRVNKNITCTVTFNCSAGIDTCKEGWSNFKKRWCASHKLVTCGANLENDGCEDDSFVRFNSSEEFQAFAANLTNRTTSSMDTYEDDARDYDAYGVKLVEGDEIIIIKEFVVWTTTTTTPCPYGTTKTTTTAQYDYDYDDGTNVTIFNGTLPVGAIGTVLSSDSDGPHIEFENLTEDEHGDYGYATKVRAWVDPASIKLNKRKSKSDGKSRFEAEWPGKDSTDFKDSVEDADIVKSSDTFIAILRRGHLFTASVPGSSSLGLSKNTPLDLQPSPADNATDPTHRESISYDELYIFNRTVVVVGYRRFTSAIVIDTFTANATGALANRQSYEIGGNITSTAASRSITRSLGSELFLYVPIKIAKYIRQPDPPSRRRRSRCGKGKRGKGRGATTTTTTTTAFLFPEVNLPKICLSGTKSQCQQILDSTNIFKGLEEVGDVYHMHTTFTLHFDDSGGIKVTGARGLLGHLPDYTHVSKEAFYMWTAHEFYSMAYRMPHFIDEVSVVRTTGVPVAYDSFHEGAENLSVLIEQTPPELRRPGRSYSDDDYDSGSHSGNDGPVKPRSQEWAMFKKGEVYMANIPIDRFRAGSNCIAWTTSYIALEAAAANPDKSGTLISKGVESFVVYGRDYDSENILFVAELNDLLEQRGLLELRLEHHR